jgi:hypothetical protein
MPHIKKEFRGSGHVTHKLRQLKYYILNFGI